MTPSNAKNSTFICDYGAAELRNVELSLEVDLMRSLLVHIKEVDVLAAPLKVVHELTRTVALLENEGIVEQLTKLIQNVNMLIVSYPARKLPQFSLFIDKFLAYAFQGTSDALKAEEIELSGVSLQELDILLVLVQFIEDVCDLGNDILLLLLAILEISKCLMFEVTPKFLDLTNSYLRN